MDNTTVKFPGTEITLAGQAFVLPPLGLLAYRRNDAFAKLKAIEEAFKANRDNQTPIPVETFDTLVELIQLALVRNYPDITQDIIYDGILDFVSAAELIPSLITQNKDAMAKMEDYQKNVEPPVSLSTGG